MDKILELEDDLYEIKRRIGFLKNNNMLSENVRLCLLDIEDEINNNYFRLEDEKELQEMCIDSSFEEYINSIVE